MNKIWIMIRACKARHWYVKDYLVPSLLEQGMPLEQILIWEDKNQVGNLQSFLDMITWIKDNMEPTAAVWLLQDDVIISSTFVERISSKEVVEFDGSVCGYCCMNWNSHNFEKTGKRMNLQKWFSFPCERIPVKYIEKFLVWFNLSVKRDDKLGDQYRFWGNHGKFDDSFWMDYLHQCHPVDKCWNYGEIINGVPQGGLVEHIDYLMGGSLANPREGDIRRLNYFWTEDELVEKLKDDLAERWMKELVELEKRDENKTVAALD